MLTFDRLEPGKPLGKLTLAFDPIQLTRWDSIFPGSIAASDVFVPSGLVVAFSMRGYVALLGERPKGNVHAGQQFVWGRRVPKGTDLVVTLTCLRKELKRERRWVWFDNRLSGREGDLHLQATMTLVWAA
jgi:hypothetical protein